MAEVIPFPAWRYNTQRVDLKNVVVPPYDVIKDAERERLAAEPNSGVRLTLEPGRASDSEASNRYTRSRDLFRRWQSDGVLVRDETPAFYVLAQEFTWDGKAYRRMHLVGAARLHEWDERVILPHEKILQGPKDDRQRLIETTRANYEPVFALSMDTGEGFRDLLARHSQGAPLLEVTLANGERNAVWRVGDPAVIGAFQDALRDSRLVIADGHHRYTASLGARADMREAHGDGPWDYLMMTISPMDDPDLLVLPTHRMVAGLEGYDLESILGRLDATFVVEEKETADEVREAMDAAEGVAIGMLAWPDSAFLLTPWSEDALMDAQFHVEQSEAWKRLDVSVLHGFVMDKVLGIGAGESPHITYTRDAGEAVASVKDGSAQLAFLTKSTPPEAVRTISLNGETMPQKSTFFYPKLLTGLLIRSWDE